MGLNRKIGQFLIALSLLAVEAEAALSVAGRGFSSNSTSGTTVTVAPTSATLNAGTFGVICLAMDNAGTGGNVKNLSSATLTDSKGNTWTRQLDAIYDPGAANAGVEIGVYTSFVTTNFTTSDSLVINLANSISDKAWTVWEVSYNTSMTVSVIATAAKCDLCTSGQTGTAVQITTPTLTVGDAVVCWMGSEQATAVTADSDTTNGSWSSQQSAAATAMRVASQTKVQTTTDSTQSYDVTITSADWNAAYLQLREVTPPSNTASFLQFFQP